MRYNSVAYGLLKRAEALKERRVRITPQTLDAMLSTFKKSIDFAVRRAQEGKHTPSTFLEVSFDGLYSGLEAMSRLGNDVSGTYQQAVRYARENCSGHYDVEALIEKYRR